MEAQNVEVAALVQKIAGLHAAIAKLPSLSPSPDVNALFTSLVMACVPPSPVDVTKLSPDQWRAQDFKDGYSKLIEVKKMVYIIPYKV
jgi:nicotianamine synthase